MFFPASGHLFGSHQFEVKINRCSCARINPRTIQRCRRGAAVLGLVMALTASSLASQPVSRTGQLLQVPMNFEVNQGQAAKSVEYLARGPGYTLLLSHGEATLSLRAKHAGVAESNASPMTAGAVKEARLEMRLAGSAHSSSSRALDPLGGIANYFLGPDPATWRTGIPTFGKVKFEEVYPGIDVIYYGNQQQLEYDFVVKPFANPRQIVFRLEGAERLEIEQNGELAIQVAGGVVRWHKPVAYQQTGMERTEVPARFGLSHGNNVTFEVGSYDRSIPLIIDPVVVYSTYLGGSRGDFALGIAVHASGSVYVVGDTTSLNFPNQSAYRTHSAGSNDLFVTKLNPSGSAILYSTYIGGTGDDYASGIAIDAAGNAFITGYTDSPNYPTKNGAYAANAGFFDIFLTKIGVYGSNVVYSTYLGGAGDDFGRAVAVDNSGRAYVTGRTYSRGTGNGAFPMTQGAYQRNNGNGVSIGADAFVARFETNGAVSYATFLGGSSDEYGNAIAVDNAGNAYVVGEVSSYPVYPAVPSSDFPVVNAFQPKFNQGSTDPFGGTRDGFLTKFNASGSALVFSTFLGGFDDDFATGVALDVNGRICATGVTSSTNFPTANAAQPLNAGMIFDPAYPGADAFVMQFQTNGTTLLYSTYLGGSSDEYPFLIDYFGIAADRFGNLYVAGQTGSPDFPVTQGADQSTSYGYDAFVAKINPAIAGPQSLIYASFLSGSSGLLAGATDNEGGPIAVDNNGYFYVAGITSATNFPVTGGAYRTVNSGGYNDAFVAKFSSPPDLAVSMIASPNPAIVGSNVTYTIRVYNSGPATFTGISNVVRFPSTVRFGSISTSAGSFSTNSGLVAFNIGVMTNNAVVTQTIIVSNVDPGVSTNIATLSSMESPAFEPNKLNNGAAVVAAVRGIADIAVAQSALPSPTYASSNLTFTINVTNKGPWTATSVMLTNPLSASLSFVSASSTVGTCSTNANAVLCNIGTLPVGVGARVTINTIANTSGTVSNAAVAGAFEADFTPGNNSSGLLTTVIPVTELALAMTATNQVYAGNNIVFTLRVTNAGPSSGTSIVLSNPFPAGTTFVGSSTTSGTTNLSNAGIGFNLGTLASNAIATVTVTLRAPVGGSTLLNTATVTNSGALESVIVNNSASASALVIANADLALTQTANPASIAVSSNITFTLLLTNRGPSPSINVVLTDALPLSFSLVSAQSTFGPCQVLNNIITCNIATLPAAASGTATIIAKANAYGVFTNIATVTSGVADLVSINNQAQAVVPVNDNPDRPALSITRVGTNVVLSWSTNATGRGFVLQTRTALSSGNAWAAVPNVPVTIGGNSVVTNALSSSGSFYRLIRSPQTLTVARVGNSIVISWPAVSSTAVLKRTTDLSNSPVWTSAGTATLVGNRYYITNSISGSRTFYRLYN